MPGQRTKVQLSIVSPTGYAASTCGYCTAPGSGQRSARKSSKSYGIWAHRLSPYHYQSLIDRGWRRSGDYIYKPDVLRTCCAQIPIRLAAGYFKPNKGHRRALTHLLFRVRSTRPMPAKWKGRWSRGRDWDLENRLGEIISTSNEGSTRSSAWAEQVAGPITQRLQVRLALASSSDEKYQLFRKYQAHIHGESEKDISSEKGFRRFLVDTSMALTWPSTGEPLTASQESQWRAKSMDWADLPDELPYGCYHQEYRLEGKLIAVGVLDILPRCVSSVYVFYDPEYKDWQLGKVSALQEIALTRQLGRLTAMNEIGHYYMGFYIHTCQKMRYKAEYKPSQLLDCGNNSWRPLVEIAASLDAKQYFGWSEGSVPASVHDATDEPAAEENDDPEERAMRVPVQPAPPPGMFDAQAMLAGLEQTLRGIESVQRVSGLRLLERAMVLEAQNQAKGIQPLLASSVFGDYVQGAQTQDDDENGEMVQMVECIAALADGELVSQMVLFM